MARKTYTIYLAKARITDFEDVLSESAEAKLRQPSTQVIEAPDFGDGAKLYVFVGFPSAPAWMTDLQSQFEVSETRTSSSCALLIFRTSERVFVVTFAHGWMYLDEACLEADFGLKVSLNALDENKLKRLERANLGDALRGVALSPFQRDFRSFGLDDALDLVRKISGSTREGGSTDMMTGARSLKVSGEISLTDLPEITADALEFFGSDEYESTSFRIIDFVRPVTDRPLISELDDLAANAIRNEQANFELGLPATQEDEGVGYKFRGPRLRGHHPDLLLRNYTSALGDRLPELTAQTLRDHKIAAVFEDGARPEQSWTIRTGLVGSVVHGGERYAINEGEWYRIEEQFRESIERAFNGLLVDWNGDEPDPLRRVYDERNNGTLQTEAEYNAELCSARGYVLLDQRLIRIPETPGTAFEACDALDIEGKRFIHVKRSSRRSSVLSHFFKQGSNSGQQFKRFEAAWTELAEEVERQAGTNARDALFAANEDERKWQIEFWIIDVPRADGNFNIPFFSKISLRDEVQNLQAMNYDIRIRFIGMEPERV